MKTFHRGRKQEYKYFTLCCTPEISIQLYHSHHSLDGRSHCKEAELGSTSTSTIEKTVLASS